MTLLKKFFKNKLVVSVLAILVLYTLAGFWLAPYLVHRLAPNMVAEKIQRELRLGNVKLNPFLFRFQAGDVGLYEQDGTLIAGLKQVFIDFEVISIFRWALVFKTIRLDQPLVNIVINTDGSLNLANLTPENPSEKKPESLVEKAQNEAARTESNQESSSKPTEKDRAPLRMILQHIQILQGEIDFIDQRQSIPANLAIRPLNIELKDISTLPDREGPYSLVATTQEQESFHWTGEITLHPFKSSGRLGFSDIRMATLWQFFRDSVSLHEPKGRISIASDYDIDLGRAEPSVLLSNLEVHLAALALKLSGDETPLLELAEFKVEAPRLDIIQQDIQVESIQLDGAHISAIVDGSGRLNWNRIQVPLDASEPRPPKVDHANSKAASESARGSSFSEENEAKTPRSWQVKVGQVAFEDIYAQFTDTSRMPPLFAEVADLTAVFGLELAAGSLGTELRVNKGSLALNDISLRNPESPEPEIGIKMIRLTGTEFDLVPRQMRIQNVSVRDGDIQLVRETDGKLNLVSLFIPGESHTQNQSGNQTENPSENQMEERPEMESGPAGSGKQVAFNYAVNSADLSGFKIAFSDKTVKADGKIIQIDNLQLGVKHMDGKSQMPAELSFDIHEGGRVELSSRINPDKPSVQAQVNVEALSLVPLESYIKPHADLRLPSGTISTRGEFTYQAEAGPALLSYTGGFDVSALQILPPDSDETLLGWNQFVTQELKFQIEPDLLEISDLKLSGLDGQFIIFEDGSLNLAQMLKKGPETASESETASGKDTDIPAEPAKAPEETDAGRPDDDVFPIYIHKLRFEDGGLFFADYSLIPQFATRIHQLEGSIIGMSSQKGARAQVQLEGRVNAYGLSKIEGEINFFDPGAYTDMAVLFRNLEMTRLTPYSGKFVGRRIDSGKLTLDLKYGIEDRKLKGDNQIIVEQIELGEKVDSEDAVSLPLNLAIAILEDANGVIDIGLPVSGDLDDPKFSYGQLIWKAFVNLVTKLATAPFRALGSLFGGDAETLDAIIFEAGSAEILPPEAEKLVKLIGALEKRPSLRLILQGRFSQAADGEALRDLKIRQAVVSRQGIALAPDEDPGLLDFGNPAVQTALEQVFSEKFGQDALTQRKQQNMTEEEDAADQPAASTQEREVQDPAAPWKKMFQALVAEAQLTEEALMQLAEARAAVVLAQLQGTTGLPPQRTMLKPAKVLKPGKTPQVKMMLEALKVKREKKP